MDFFKKDILTNVIFIESFSFVKLPECFKESTHLTEQLSQVWA